ncbi:MAG: NAD(P)H-dependent oxidoreductase [Defluviitaleaceae bacterium]|nr:NAD(P)H-dependent oxidoreductase [Defluviitaleaceae bacterium]
MKKILIISGTPKTEGLTYSFVQAAQEQAATLGIEAETIRLAGYGLSKCVMCDDGWGVCFREHYCIFGKKDGFAGLQEKVREADAYIYITPVYWGEISEELKIFIDKLRRCEATKQWDAREDQVSFLKGKPSIMVAAAGGGGGGIVTAFADFERAIAQWGGDNWPRETSGIFDYIAVNRWNQAYKLEALKAAISQMVKYSSRPKAVKIAPKPDYHLLITFDNGERRVLDVNPYLETEPYSALKDPELFHKVKIAGLIAEWRPRLDMGIDILYDKSTPV